MSDLEALKKALPNFMSHYEETLREFAFLQEQVDSQDELHEEIEQLRAENKALKGQLKELMLDKEIGEVL